MLSFRPKPGKSLDFEELFFAYYERLLEWALQLTRRDHADAEDLVHDLYVYLARSSSRPDNIEKMDAYLFSILRNLHYARLRRAGRSPIDDLSIVEFDSIERGLASVDRRELLDVRTNLRAICEYVCQRKNTSRSASILILRFFFGYYPSELLQLVRTTRSGLDQALVAARQEAKLYVERPNALRSILPQQAITLFPGISDNSHKLFLELRRAIFSTCVGPCFGQAELERRYEKKATAAFTVEELAHLVSCPICLDQANTILGLPLLDDRSPDETLGRDNSQGPDGPPQGPTAVPSSGASSKKARKDARTRNKLERRMREFFEHRPRTLQIAVDGKPRAAQKVTAEISELRLKLGHLDKPQFIEVLSEQNLCMAYLHVHDPAEEVGLMQTERVVLSDGRSLEVTLSFASDVPTIHVVYRDPVFLEDASAVLDSPTRLTFTDSSTALALAGREPRAAARVSRWLLSFRDAFTRIMPDMNPTLATALVLFAGSLVFFAMWFRQSPPKISANAMLVRAEHWDTAKSATPGVIYQKVRIKTPNRALERTLYRDAQGVRVPRKQQLTGDDAALEAQLSQAGVDWNAPLSASSYQDWHDHQHERQDTITVPGAHLLKLTTTVAQGNVVRASLTVRDTDFHPIERTIELRDAGTVEVAELNYDVLPWGAVNENWFEPLAAATLPPTNGVPHAALMPHLPAVLGEMELDEAELSARLALHQLGADTSERVELNRTPAGVQVRGIVATDARKHEIEAALRLVPHVVPDLYTFRDIENRKGPAGDVTSIRSTSTVEVPSPLETYLVAHGMTHEAVGELGHDLFSSYVTVEQEGKAIADLQRRFAGHGTLNPKAQESLDLLTADHRQRLLAALREQERLLAQTKISIPARNGGAPIVSLDAALQHDVALCSELVSGGEAARSAEVIVPELARSVAQLRAVLGAPSVRSTAGPLASPPASTTASPND